jgi:hypothetical protein
MYLPILNLALNVVFSLKIVFCSLTLLFSYPGDEDMRQLRASAKMVTAVTKLSAAHLRYPTRQLQLREKGGGSTSSGLGIPLFFNSLKLCFHACISLAFRDISLNNTVR